MNATTVLNDLQYVIDKKSQYLQRCCSEGKSKKALEIELATLEQAKELLEELALQQEEAKAAIKEAKAAIKEADKAMTITEAFIAEYHFATYYNNNNYAGALFHVLNWPEIHIANWKEVKKFIKSDWEFATQTIEKRLNPYVARDREFYQSWCKSAHIDYSKRERAWQMKWETKNSENSCQI